MFVVTSPSVTGTLGLGIERGKGAERSTPFRGGSSEVRKADSSSVLTVHTIKSASNEFSYSSP